jgi:hypothetical protein
MTGPQCVMPPDHPDPSGAVAETMVCRPMTEQPATAEDAARFTEQVLGGELLPWQRQALKLLWAGPGAGPRRHRPGTGGFKRGPSATYVIEDEIAEGDDAG